MPFLQWVNKNQAVQTGEQVPYHLLHHQSTHGDVKSAQENMIIQGDNLQALKALLPFYAGKVKCIFIDPPYNTQTAFEHYDDKLEHSQWLSMMYPRLVLLRELLAEDGSIWVTLDDREAHYFKVIMDEIFGRNNFVANIIWQKKYAATNDSKKFSALHDHVFLYTKNGNIWRPNLLARSDELNAKYANPDNDPRGNWYSTNLSVKTYSEANDYEIISPAGLSFRPPPTRAWVISKQKYEELLADNRIWFGKNGKSRPYKKTFLSEVQEGVVPTTLWNHKFAGHNIGAKTEMRTMFGNQNNLFNTPKPELLLNKIIHIATNENDLILDSFLGSGTTAAVAHKMNRRYIGIEMGAHAITHCLPRLEKVIEGEQGGISKEVNWQGGGGFSFYTLGAPVFDAEGHITPNVRFKDLAAYVWWLETQTAMGLKLDTQLPFIGEHEGVAYYLLYNGILGDRRPNGGNVLTSVLLAHLLALHPHTGKKVIFGEATRLGEARLNTEQIEFKQIPYELHNRV
ncbi:site-specific DNA-methyltransferase [Snodgrassella sp. ESL0253]|uniref:site-specific DNA-methyltransferase n=1 Tax=Snodgrassella sp. ESL0253 TaxID=2705031 RepID=UPI0015822FA2|nr:site-specific DNA-methyltransferase [Snodgrassella sp. ESL0253]NUE66339.1 site-specific DNA-methyltransferase [Snodgrassella sp. ESL0253]